jgi:hypothetical protein
MGRLAGPTPKSEEAHRKAVEEWEAHRRYVASITPIVHPSAGRRQMALLWYISQQWHGPTITVGWRGSPPLTDDMRALIRKGHLVLRRTWRGATSSYGPPGTNEISVTPAGNAALSRARIRDVDKHYIEMALKTGVVR